MAAFTPEAIAEAEGHLHHYAANRETLLAVCARSASPGWRPPTARSTSTPTSRTSPTDSLTFCEKLLADTGLAIAPGIDFDTVHGGSFVRLSFAGPTSDIDEALRRLGPWLAR